MRLTHVTKQSYRCFNIPHITTFQIKNFSETWPSGNGVSSVFCEPTYSEFAAVRSGDLDEELLLRGMRGGFDALCCQDLAVARLQVTFVRVARLEAQRAVRAVKRRLTRVSSQVFLLTREISTFQHKKKILTPASFAFLTRVKVIGNCLVVDSNSTLFSPFSRRSIIFSSLCLINDCVRLGPERNCNFDLTLK